jgi:hypothetical protein
MGGATIYTFHPVRGEPKGKTVIVINTMQDLSGWDIGCFLQEDVSESGLKPFAGIREKVVFYQPGT